jgi:hypothetical protein
MTAQAYLNKAPLHPPFANRQPWPLRPDTADFSDFGDRITLGRLGIFSVDRTAHRLKRALESQNEQMIEAAYAAIGKDRDAEHRKIAAELEATMTSGIWARSTGEYARRCRELDSAVAERVYTGEVS